MKFRDKKTGKVLDDIDVVRKDFCRGRPSCVACPFDCGKFVREHPYEAAPLLDCEVIDDTPTDTPTTLDDTPTGSGDRPTKEDNMDKQDKPLSEWTLGEAMKFCHRDDSFCTRGDEECPFFRTVCQERVADWDLKKEMRSRPADPEREGLGPSPTGETEAPREDVGEGSKPARPRLAEVLGVEVGEQFAIKGLA